ncbi:hypothetical protein [Methylobacterium tardum]|uniref:hypothetical protein n=1 Tax=Methylobacterium tardum TaxID=374432 RepID=UPI00360DF2C1
MLALITSRIPGPATESADRDPGFLTLVFAVARAVRTGSETAFARRCALARAVGGPNPSDGITTARRACLGDCVPPAWALGGTAALWPRGIVILCRHFARWYASA